VIFQGVIPDMVPFVGTFVGSGKLQSSPEIEVVEDLAIRNCPNASVDEKKITVTVRTSFALLIFPSNRRRSV
jgi:hypothetical protein